MAKVGYIRVSSREQNNSRQMKNLEEQGCEKIFTDTVSGKNRNRPGLQELFSYLREGDILIVDSYSRFSRSTSDLLKMVEELKILGVEFISLKEKIDTSTPAGKMFLTIIASIAEFERDQIRERQLEGIAIAKKEGKYKGRGLKITDEYIKIYDKWKKNEITATAAHKKLGISRASFYNLAKRYEIEGVQQKII